MFSLSIPERREGNNLAYFIARGECARGGRGKREAGSCEGTEKSEDGDKRQIRSALYTILIPRSHDYLLVFIWFPTFPYSFFLGLSGAAQLCRSISRTF